MRFIPIVVLALVAVACAEQRSVLDELKEIAPVEAGTPVLVFVYVDG